MLCIQIAAFISMFYITQEVLNDPITVQACLGESGEEIVKWVDAYKFEVSCELCSMVSSALSGGNLLPHSILMNRSSIG